MRYREPTVLEEDSPHQLPAVPAQLNGASSPAAATGEDGPFCRVTALARKLLDAPVAFVALPAAPLSRWPSHVSACPPGLLADAFCRNILRGGTPPVLAVDDTRADPRTRDNPLVAITGATAWACRPVKGPAGETLGMFCVLDTAVRAWTARDIEVVAGLAFTAAGELGLRNDAARAARDTRRLNALTAQTAAQARALQDSLLPPHLPGVPGMQVAARYLPAADGLGVLGDFYDLFPGPRDNGDPRPRMRPRPGGRWDAVIGDVCGHGVEAATVTALARYTIRAVAMREDSPARVLGGLNAALLAQRPDSERFLTAAYVMLFPTRGRVDALLTSAGHTPALLRDSGGAVHAVGRPGLPLGLFDRPDLYDSRLSLSRGDTLLLYTDGVTEARRGREQYGEERLRDLFAGAARLDVHDLAHAVENDVLAFTGGPHTDDIAVLALRVDDPPRRPVSGALRITDAIITGSSVMGSSAVTGGRPHGAV
jgi:serine phosphatase RsbU (regulator of sigma subunit)